MPRPNLFRSALVEASARAVRYLEGIGDRRVSPAEADCAALRSLGGELPEWGQSPEGIVTLLDNVGSPATVASMGGRYFGFVVGGSLPAALGAHWLADAWDQNACLSTLSPVAAYLENVVSAWVLDLFGLPATCATGFVTGAQMANFACLAAARHSVLTRQKWNVEGDGLFGAPAIAVFVGEEVHATVLKSLAMLGLGRGRVRTVPADSHGRVRPESLAQEMKGTRGPAIVCVQAGNVNTGSCDPLDLVCEIAHNAGAWVHIDGAFGLWAAAAPQRRSLLSGIGVADSWATDAHKWLNVPQDSGIAIVRDVEALRASMAISAAYLAASDQREPMHFVPESSRRARAIEIWAAMRSLGKQGIAELVERTCRHAVTFAEGIREAGFEVLNEVVLNQVLVSFGTDDMTDRIVRAIQDDGTCWCGGTVWKGRKAMRISVSSWATTEEDVKLSLGAITRIASITVRGGAT